MLNDQTFAIVPIDHGITNPPTTDPHNYNNSARWTNCSQRRVNCLQFIIGVRINLDVSFSATRAYVFEKKGEQVHAYIHRRDTHEGGTRWRGWNAARHVFINTFSYYPRLETVKASDTATKEKVNELSRRRRRDQEACLINSEGWRGNSFENTKRAMDISLEKRRYMRWITWGEEGWLGNSFVNHLMNYILFYVINVCIWKFLIFNLVIYLILPNRLSEKLACKIYLPINSDNRWIS